MSDIDPSQPANRAPDDAEWTPAAGIRRGVVHGLIAATLLAAATMALAYFVPLLVLRGTLRSALAFLIAFVLFSVVQRAAGFVGWPCTLIVVAYSTLVLFSHHLVFAVRGVQLSQGVASGAGWLAWPTLLIVNTIPMIFVAFCAMICHHGGFGFWDLVEKLGRRRSL
ncbi:hypothetical protein RAS1_25000 [Phycisphaerae bacterium RAS1]|nr:hypothetical protein RAS1_25000 [Phycisphaerae bacterium RAS1]